MPWSKDIRNLTAGRKTPSLGSENPAVNADRTGFKKVRFWLRFLVAMLIGGTIYALGLWEVTFSALGGMAALLIFSCYIDPQWALGMVARPWFEYLSKNHYDIFLHTTRRDDGD